MVQTLRTYQRVECRFVRERAEEPYLRTLDHHDAVARLLRPMLSDPTQETFVVVLLDARSRLIGIHVASTGSLTEALVEPSGVFRAALVAGAARIVLCHNHPSMDCTPSAEDVALTRRLVEAGLMIGIPVLDHVVIGGEAHFSFAQHGLIEG